MGFYDNEQSFPVESQNTADYAPQVPIPPQSNQYDKLVQEEKVANFVSQTSPTRTLVKIDFILKGFIYDEMKKSWIKVADAVPDKVRLDFLQVMTPHLSEDVRMGRMDSNQINSIMSFCIEWTVDYLDIVADEHKLTEEQMTKISFIMWSAVFHTLCRSLNGVERDRMYNSLKLGDNFGEYAKQEEKKSVLDAILPWK
jgi:hypothetical protein